MRVNGHRPCCRMFMLHVLQVFPDGVLTGKGESPLKQPNFDIQQEQSENVDVQNVDEHTNGQPLTSGFE